MHSSMRKSLSRQLVDEFPRYRRLWDTLYELRSALLGARTQDVVRTFNADDGLDSFFVTIASATLTAAITLQYVAFYIQYST